MADVAFPPSAVLAALRQARTQTALRTGALPASAFAPTVRAASADASAGSTYTDQLVAKTQMARAILEQYTTIGVYDEAACEAAIAAIEAWKAQHQGLWSRIQQKLLGVTDSVSSDEALQMPAELVRAYVEALFLTAAYSLNMYTNGVFARQVNAGQVSAAFVQSDAEARLNMLDVIVTMETEGTLDTVYRAAGSAGTSGLGIEQFVVIGLVVVAVLAVIVGGVIYYRQTTANNALKQQACQTFLATRDPLLEGSCDPVETDAVTIAKYAVGAFALGGFLYLFLPEVPKLVKGFRS